MGNKIKRLICSLLASAMLVTSAGMISFAADDDTADTADTAVTETVDDSSTADQTDEEKEAADAEGSADTTADTATEAADTTEATETEATAAPEASETTETEATPAPASTSSGKDYSSDNYYDKALSLCSSLGIISGYEDGSVRPESNVTRAEMASIVLRMLATNSYSTYQNIFTDVTSSHWAADQIQSAYEAKIISGMGDGTFAPDAEVTYAQVIVMLVNACGYQDDAEYYGGWQQGYIKAAGDTDLNLLKNAPGSADVASDRGTVIKMVYNALLGDYKKVVAYDGGQPKYSTDKTLAEEKFDVIEEKGILWGTAKTSLVGDLQDGQIAITPDKEDDYVTYDTNLTGLEEYLAQKVTYYYKENSGLTAEVLAVTYDSSKSETYVVPDLDDIENVTGFENGEGQYKINKVSKAKKTTSDVNIVYNGKLLDVDEVAKSGDDINDLLWPEVGSVKLVKSDKNNDDFDTVFVDSYETVVVNSATDTKLIGKIQDPNGAVGVTKGITYTLDDKEDRTITVTKGGSEIRLRNLKKNDVASVKASYSSNNSPEVIDVVVTGESVTGSASSVSIKMDNTYATINGDKYDVANVAAGDLQTGAQCTFFLDMFGRVGYIEGTANSRLASGEKYGWFIESYKAEDGSNYMVKLMTQEGEQHLKLANKIDYWAPKVPKGDKNAGVSKTKNEMEEILKNIDDDFFLRTYTTDTDTSMYVFENNGKYGKGSKFGGTNTNIRPTDYVKTNTQIRFLKYKTNSSGAVTELYFAVPSANVAASKYYVGQPDYDTAWLKTENGGITDPYLSDDDIAALKSSNALLFNLSNKSGSTLVAGMVGGYVITDDIIEFGVPSDVADQSDADAYRIANVNAGSYNQRENGLSDDWYAADADGTKPGAIIRFIENTTKPINPVDMDNVGGPASMVVDSIDIGVDDDENTIYVINGYLGGSEVSVTTSKTSALAELTGYQNNRKYTSTGGTSIVSWAGNGTVWTADDDTSLTNYLHEGDIIITDGKYILIYASARDVYDMLLEGKSVAKTVSGSETRNYYWFDMVTDSDISDVAWMSIGGKTLSTDSSTPFDVVEIDLAARNAASAVSISDDLASVTDVEVYDPESDEFDYAYARFANKGSLQEVIVYRIKNADLIGSKTAAAEAE